MEKNGLISESVKEISRSCYNLVEYTELRPLLELGPANSSYHIQCMFSAGKLICWVYLMVFIIDGCSFHYAHTWSKSDISICWRHLVTSKESLNSIFFEKRPCLHHTCATWNEQPSIINTTRVTDPDPVIEFGSGFLKCRIHIWLIKVY